MPQKGDTQVNNFVKGYITEASPLNFPEGASLDEVNMKLKRDGTRERRLGLDYEDSYTLQPTGQTAAQLAASRQRAFVWPTPSGFTDVEIGVIQIGTKLYFIDLFTENPSANVLNSGNAFDASTASDVIDNTAVFDFALINNNLIVVSSGLDTPFILYYDGDTDTVTWDTARIEIRDLYGVTDGLDDDERPTTLSDAHKYNLRNQGWNTNIVTKNGAEVLTETFNGIGGYPSNSDTWSLGKIADVTDADVDKYDAETLKRNSFDIGRAPRGHYIIDLYNRGNSRETLTSLTMPTVDREVRRISTVASMGGRLFYSGINSKVVGKDVSPKLSGAVLFSQIAKSDADLVKCYQEADPTSPNSNELVDTDGGIIFITEASNIIKIQNTQGSVLVFAENGVWEIRGDEGGFRATSFQVNKISNIGVIARESIVDANGTIYFWGRDGIYTMTPNQLGTGYDTVNITLNTIQSAFNTLPDFTKRGVKAYYDQSENSIRWLLNMESTANVIDVPAPAPVPFTIGSEAKTSTVNVTSAHACTLTSTKYVIAISDTALTWKIIVANVSGTTVTLGTPQVAVAASIGSPSLVRVARMTDSSFLLFTNAAGDGTKARVITLDANDTISVGTAYTYVATSGFIPHDMVTVSSTVAVVGARNSGTGDNRFLPLDLSSGTPVGGTELLATLGGNTGSIVMKNTTSGRALVSTQDKTWGISVTGSTVTEDGAELTTAGNLYQGGISSMNLFSDGNVAVSNTAQVAIVSGTGSPPSEVADTEGVTNPMAITQGNLTTVGHKSTYFAAIFPYNNVGVESRAIRLIHIKQVSDGDADGFPGLDNVEAEPYVTLLSDDGDPIKGFSFMYTGNLLESEDKVFWIAVDSFGLDLYTQVITIGS